MKILLHDAGRWLAGVAWLLVSGVHSQSNTSVYSTQVLRTTYPNCTVHSSSYPDDDDYVAPYIIKDQKDADSLNGCNSVRGHIRIADCSPGVTSIVLNDVQSIPKGSLDVSNCDQLENFTASRLESMDTSYGGIFIGRLPQLTSLQLPLLQHTGSQLTLSDAPLLSTVTAPRGLFSILITITNTSISNLDFLYPAMEEMVETETNLIDLPSLVIYDNPHLNNITVSGLLFYKVSIYNNGPATHINLPKFYSCEDLYVSNTASLNVSTLYEVKRNLSIVDSSIVDLSIPKLHSVGRSILIANNTALKHFDATPWIVGELYSENSLSISDNPSLLTISLNRLQEVQSGFIISKNPSLSSIFMDDLSSVHMDFNISGNLSSFSLPSWHPNSYSFYYMFINSTNPNFDCSVFDQLAADKLKPHVEHLDRYYACGAYVESSSKDTATHWKAPKKGIHKPGNLAAVVICSVAGAMLLTGLIWKCRKVEDRRTSEAAAAVALADLPPTYARMPKSHEVPPVYGRHAPAGSETASPSELNAPPVPAELAMETRGSVENSTVQRPLTPPEYTEHSQPKETRSSSEVETAHLPSSPTVWPGRTT